MRREHSTSDAIASLSLHPTPEAQNGSTVKTYGGEQSGVFVTIHPTIVSRGEMDTGSTFRDVRNQP